MPIYPSGIPFLGMCDGVRRGCVRALVGLVGWVMLFGASGPARAQSLRGSAASLDRQNRQARQHDFTYLRSAAQLRRFVRGGYLVPVASNGDYSLKDVSFPFARPEVKLFVERLAGQYRRACGEELVVTSLTRPQSHQPRNASPRSVHPTGMAADIRRPDRGRCRNWLEETLVDLERRRVLEATLERSPPHFHVAIFPRVYSDYVAGLNRRASSRSATQPVYTVRRRDTLWKISRRYGTTPPAIRRANGLSSTVIYPGQSLNIP